MIRNTEATTYKIGQGSALSFPLGLEFAASQVATSTNTSAQITPTANVNQLYRLHNRTANRLSFAIAADPTAAQATSLALVGSEVLYVNIPTDHKIAIISTVNGTHGVIEITGLLNSF
tara:strand:+ start:15 stop:368 length:354 start_codon:yes stop_codon:yes gene_type:complete